jgi:hypothetical protein
MRDFVWLLPPRLSCRQQHFTDLPDERLHNKFRARQIVIIRHVNLTYRHREFTGSTPARAGKFAMPPTGPERLTGTR